MEVKLPIKLEVDNQGTVDMAQNVTVGGRTKYMKIMILSLRELQEKGILNAKWVNGYDNEVYIQKKFTSLHFFYKNCKV